MGWMTSYVVLVIICGLIYLFSPLWALMWLVFCVITLEYNRKPKSSAVYYPANVEKGPRGPLRHDLHIDMDKVILDDREKGPSSPSRKSLLPDSFSSRPPCFVDSKNRQMILRGVNLGGCSKLPSKGIEHFEMTVSFKNRPFKIEEADDHCKFLSSCGFNFIRLLVPWEAIEHLGPGKYDEEYLEYLKSLVQVMGKYGLSVFIDPHQDCWSRFSGGSGAPRWTLELCGFDISKFHETKSSLVESHANKNESPYHPMVWPSNYLMFACPTIFTLFFCGNKFAPKCKVIDHKMVIASEYTNAESIQDYLQRHYFSAYQRVADLLKNEPNVLGFETMNEPSQGFVGCRFNKFNGKVGLGYKLTPWDATQLANGASLKRKYYRGILWGVFGIGHTEQLNANKIKVWLPAYDCIWKAHGVWHEQHGLLQPNYFQEGTTDFQSEFMRPFWRKFTESIRSQIPDALIFLGPTIDLANPQVHIAKPEDALNGRSVWAPHYYDGITLMTRYFQNWIGFSVSAKYFPIKFTPPFVFNGLIDDLKSHKSGGNSVGPTLIGEIGVPWLGERSDDAMDFSLTAAEISKVDAITIWNYSPNSCWIKGDRWNGEDLSICTDGILRIPSSVRPYPIKISGRLHSYIFHYHEKQFTLKFTSINHIESEETEIFIPKMHFPRIKVDVSDGNWSMGNNQILIFTHNPLIKEHTITVTAI
jgi:Glycoside hydrolase family 5 C-terminal domain/Cellulase (glycosyl hydrolase family 5)